MTAQSIGAAKGQGYARYLESKTALPARGDYYLTPTGEPAQAPGRWIAEPRTLARLGIASERVRAPDFIALMEGRHPKSGRYLRPAGAGGGRGGGIDLTFSAPKSVSALWALGDERARAGIEQAHALAVRAAIGHLTGTVPTIRRRYGPRVAEERAAGLVAAEYRHTTARGVIAGETPDPHLHSHVVLTCALRSDGELRAVASRPVFRAARELGAYYRSALAAELKGRGYAIKGGTGRHGRYFELDGVPRGLVDAFSSRSQEVARAAERFRAKWGRAPARGELRQLKLQNRKAKTLATRTDLERAWKETARRFGFVPPRRSPAGRRVRGAGRQRRATHHLEGQIEDRVEERLIDRAATFSAGELRAACLEQSVGLLDPGEALALCRRMARERRVLPLQGALMTTLRVRAAEQAIERRLGALAAPAGHGVSGRSRALAGDRVAERVGAPLSAEQRKALRVITGPERAAILVGPAGTGKGVVIDAAARAEQYEGRRTLGIAVAGSRAQGLAHESPALRGKTLTLDALLARVERGRLAIDERTTIYFDEAGMADTRRLSRLVQGAERSGAKLVMIGDAAQLPAIGAGGMFERLTSLLPSAELKRVRRTADPAERRAWADLRAGRAERALAHYLQRGRLHIADTREEALEAAAQTWAALTARQAVAEVALISDASNVEIARLNARAQALRMGRGELGAREAAVPGTHYGLREGDRVALIAQHHEPGRPRVENGSRGEVVRVGRAGEVVVAFDLSGERRRFAGAALGRLRLGYAQHIHRAQGQTVTRALVVTGGWQTAKEPAYVEASRARAGTDWFVSREDLGSEGQDAGRIARLARRMGESRAQRASLAYAEVDRPGLEPGRWRLPRPGPVRLPAVARARSRRAAGRESVERSR